MSRLSEAVESGRFVVTSELLSVDVGGIDAVHRHFAPYEEWVDAVKQGKSTNKLIPVEAEQTMENADLLERRLIFLRKKVLP